MPSPRNRVTLTTAEVARLRIGKVAGSLSAGHRAELRAASLNRNATLFVCARGSPGFQSDCFCSISLILSPSDGRQHG
jgi:hypothetical protein